MQVSSAADTLREQAVCEIRTLLSRVSFRSLREADLPGLGTRLQWKTRFKSLGRLKRFIEQERAYIWPDLAEEVSSDGSELVTDSLPTGELASLCPAARAVVREDSACGPSAESERLLEQRMQELLSRVSIQPHGWTASKLSACYRELYHDGDPDWYKQYCSSFCSPKAVFELLCPHVLKRVSQGKGTFYGPAVDSVLDSARALPDYVRDVEYKYDVSGVLRLLEFQDRYGASEGVRRWSLARPYRTPEAESASCGLAFWYVQDVSGVSVVVECPAMSTARDLQCSFEEMRRFPTDEKDWRSGGYQLWYQGVCLEPEALLADSGVCPESVLEYRFNPDRLWRCLNEYRLPWMQEVLEDRGGMKIFVRLKSGTLLGEILFHRDPQSASLGSEPRACINGVVVDILRLQDRRVVMCKDTLKRINEYDLVDFHDDSLYPRGDGSGATYTLRMAADERGRLQPTLMTI